MPRRFSTRIYLRSRPFLIVLIIALVCAFALTAYQAITSIVVEQSQIQQQAVTPVYKLVNQELLKPLHIAQSFAETVNFDGKVSSTDINETELLNYLALMEERLGLTVFVALDKPRRQYMSSGQAFDIIEGKVYWYFEALAEDKDIIADLGQVGDVHLFFDVKIFDKTDSFLGFVGVGKRVQAFLDKFEEYKQQYGYDFLFVNERNEILLTSIPDLIVIDEYVPELSDIPAFAEPDAQLDNLDSSVIKIDDASFLISEIFIEELQWRLLLLIPLQDRQTTITKTLFLNGLLTFTFIASFLAMAYFLLLKYKFKLEESSLKDPLTQLPNRAYLHRQYLRFRKDNTSLCVVICDLDRFKAINDTYGHNAGDEVLKSAASVLGTQLRHHDAVGRWGGEEFVLLIPAASPDMGEMLAERARQEIAKAEIYHQGQRINITASFGVAFGSSTQPMAKLVGMADVALYKAKEQGRNRVIVHLQNTKP